MAARAASGVVSGTWAITSPVMGERAGSPCAVSASSGTPSRLSIASASSRTADPGAAGIPAASPEVAHVDADPSGQVRLPPVGGGAFRHAVGRAQLVHAGRVGALLGAAVARGGRAAALVGQAPLR